MDTSSVSSSTGHSHLNGHKSMPPETLKAVVEASLKAVGQVKAMREAVRLLSRRHQEYEKYNDERWEALNARISQLENARPDKVPQDDHVNLVNGHSQHSQNDVSECPQDDEDVINGQDEEIPTLTTFPPVQDSFTSGAVAQDVTSPSGHSHVSQSRMSHFHESSSSAIPREQAGLSPVKQSVQRSQSFASPPATAQPANHTVDMHAGPSSRYHTMSLSPMTQIQSKPFDIIPERLSARDHQRALENEGVEGYEDFIEEMEGAGKGKGKAKVSTNGVREGSPNALNYKSNGLRDVDIEGNGIRSTAAFPFRHRDPPEPDMNGGNIGEQYKAIKAEYTRLKAWERQLEKQAARQEEIKAIHLDHEEELEKRLQAVIKREEKVQRAEAVLDMRSRGSKPHEIEAANYRRVEDARAIRDECKRRAEELNEAEEAWCRAKKVDYVPVIKDGQWPFNVFPLDRC